jgi:hypothetical protein
MFFKFGPMRAGWPGTVAATIKSEKSIAYLKETQWNQNDLIVGANGIAALTFCDVPLRPAK